MGGKEGEERSREKKEGNGEGKVGGKEGVERRIEKKEGNGGGRREEWERKG